MWWKIKQQQQQQLLPHIYIYIWEETNEEVAAKRYLESKANARSERVRLTNHTLGVGAQKRHIERQGEGRSTEHIIL